MDNSFSHALRMAVSRGGLSLEQISVRLREAGRPVSVSALSNWQTGENQPERPASLAALREMEKILRVPQGALADLLPPRRPRGRWQPRPAGVTPWENLWHMPDSIVRALAKLDATPQDLERPTIVSNHVTRRFDRSGNQVAVRTYRVVRAEVATSRFIHLSRCDSLPQPPTVTDAKGCRLMRFRADVATATCAFEFRLERALEPGELGLIEFSRRYPPGQADTKATLRIGKAQRDLAVQLCFDPQRLPARCYSFHQATVDSPETVVRDFRGDQVTATVQFVSLDAMPGIHGVRWEWNS